MNITDLGREYSVGAGEVWMSGGDARRRPRPVGLTIPFDLICPMIANPLVAQE